MSQIPHFTPLHDRFGMEVGGIDLGAPLADAAFEALRDAFDAHSLLVFRDQDLDPAAQVRFSARFGMLESAITRLGDDDAGRHVSNLSNLDADGQVFPADDRTMLFHLANQLWHTDSTFKASPALASVLAARQVPPRGGETEYVSTRAAWRDLPAERREALEGLVAVHDLAYSRALAAPGREVLGAELRAAMPPREHPLVRRNPRHGAAAIYVASHAERVVGMSAEEGRALLDELTAWCTRPGLVHAHRWRPGDVVMWDNRATMHRGRPWDPAAARVMHRTTVVDPEYAAREAA